MNRPRRLAWVLSGVVAGGMFVASPALAQVGKSAGVLDANLASEKELQAVPHVTPEIARAIVAGRPFPNAVALDAVLARSLQPDRIKQAYGKLFVPVNLNAASREEILLIPGVGPRMAGEFLEYRPYRGMEEFRREIGKYVDEAEVARLERYVTLEPQP